MAPKTLREQLLAATDAYCQATGRSASRVSTVIFNDGKRLGAIKDGGDLATGVFERAMSWFSSNLPEGVDWPDGLYPRPVTEADQAGAAE
jgi:hypothetical protein